MERLLFELGETLAKEPGGSENALTVQKAGIVKGMGSSVAASRLPAKGVRVGLADITNTYRPSLPSKLASPISGLRNEIGNLRKENLMFRKLLDDRNRIIEADKVLIEKLQMNSQKLYTQNLQLANSYTQMLKEVNTAKDKLKEKQHEYGCALAMIKARFYERKEKATKVDDVPLELDNVATTTHQLNTQSETSSLKWRRKSTPVELLSGIEENIGVELADKKRQMESMDICAEHAELKKVQIELLDKDVTEHPPQSKEIQDDVLKALNRLTVSYLNGNNQDKMIPAASVDPQDDFNGPHISFMGFTKSDEYGILMDRKPTETNRRMLRSASRAMEPEQSNPEVKDVVSSSESLVSDIISCAFNVDTEDMEKVRRRRSYRVAAHKAVSYKEKKINMKERRPS